ncbi:MAG: hypothetical protein HZA52_14800 [Planctomycetes bacterium]|nr:hypothetical protein [Planctomycetota bacterium]
MTSRFLRMQRARASRRGAALFVALFAAASVAVLATCLLQLTGASQKRQLASADLRRAFYLADAGLAEAYSGLTIGKTGNVGSEAQPAKLGRGVLWVVATEIDADHVQLESVGMCGRSRATVEMTVERGEDSVATLGVFAHQPLTVPAGSTIQGFDSSAAPADPGSGLLGELGGLGGFGGLGGGSPPVSTPAGRLGSNGDITLQGTARKPTVVDADLAPGVGHQAVIGAHVTHTGATAPRAAAAPLPAVELPFDPTGTGVDLQTPTPYIVQPGDIGIDHLTVATGTHAIVQGPCNLVVNDLTVAVGGTLEFDTDDGAVGVWVGDTLLIADGSTVVCSHTDPSLVTIQVASDVPARFGAAGKFYGVLYAPQAEATVGATAEVYGAFVADELVLTAGAKLNFDTHLDEVGALEILPTLLAWRLVELESALRHGEGSDPFEILGVDPAGLVTPAQAHADVPLHVVYQTLGGVTMTYDGMESGFDWTSVRSVQQLERSGLPVGYRPASVADLAAQTKPSQSTAAAALAQDPPLSSSALTTSLIAASPLTSSELTRIINASARFAPSDLKLILLANSPLASSVLDKTLLASPALPSADAAAVLIASSPLPPHIVAQILADALSLDIADKLAVLAAQ